MTLLVDREHIGLARMKIIPFTTSTLTDQQFLSGEHDARETIIAGELRVPSTPHGKVPAVVLIHGSNGAGAREHAWSDILTGQGIATFILDSFSGRGIDTTASDQTQLGRLAMILDIYRAVELLAAHKEIDPQHIAVMGFSRGGQAALYSSMKRFRNLHAPRDMQIAAYISFYPDCSTRFLGDDEVEAKPIRIHHGTADDYNPLKSCEAYVERLQAAGADVVLSRYPDAHHVFDTPNPDTPKFSPTAQTVRHCTLQESQAGQIINSATGKPFTYRDPGVELGTTTGQHSQARQDAIDNVTSFLANLFH